MFKTFFILIVGCVVNVYGSSAFPWDNLDWKPYWIGIAMHAASIAFTIILLSVFFPDYRARIFKRRTRSIVLLVGIAAFLFAAPQIYQTFKFEPTPGEFAIGVLFTFFIGWDEELFNRKFVLAALEEYGIWIAVGVSSFLFGISHFYNYIYGGQSFSYTLEQVVQAAGFGVLMCGLYFLTGKLIVPIIFHAIRDLPWQFMPEGDYHEATQAQADWGYSIVSVSIYIAFGLFLVFYSRQNFEATIREKFPSLVGAE